MLPRTGRLLLTSVLVPSPGSRLRPVATTLVQVGVVLVGYLTGFQVAKKMVALVFRWKGPSESHLGVCVGKEVCDKNSPLSHRAPSFPKVNLVSFHRKRK